MYPFSASVMDLMAIACLLDCVLIMKEIKVSPCLHTLQYSNNRILHSEIASISEITDTVL